MFFIYKSVRYVDVDPCTDQGTRIEQTLYIEVYDFNLNHI